MVDKEYVWINLPGKNSYCTEFEEGKSYLIFANRQGEDLFIAIDSKSTTAQSVFAKDALQQLGETKLIVSSGEFSLQKSPIYDLAFAFLILAICALLIYRWIKKQNI